jgi:inorganic pyrophosphatase
MAFPAELDIRIDTARGGFVKRRDDGSIDYVSPLPSPFNYGSVNGTRSHDGDREDVIVLGSRLTVGSTLRAKVLGRVQFVDAGVADPKWVCGEELTPSDLRRVRLFFWFYARAKWILNLLRGDLGVTRFDGIELPG